MCFVSASSVSRRGSDVHRADRALCLHRVVRGRSRAPTAGSFVDTFDEWTRRYVDSDPESRSREPAGVEASLGPFSEIIKAWQGASFHQAGITGALVPGKYGPLNS